LHVQAAGKAPELTYAVYADQQNSGYLKHVWAVLGRVGYSRSDINSSTECHSVQVVSAVDARLPLSHTVAQRQDCEPPAGPEGQQVPRVCLHHQKGGCFVGYQELIVSAGQPGHRRAQERAARLRPPFPSTWRRRS
jgi:hypothetical protein